MRFVSGQLRHLLRVTLLVEAIDICAEGVRRECIGQRPEYNSEQGARKRARKRRGSPVVNALMSPWRRPQ